MKNKAKKLNLKKCTISNLEMSKVTGGVVHSCIPTCNTNPTTPTTNPTGTTDPTGQSGIFRCDVITKTDL